MTEPRSSHPAPGGPSQTAMAMNLLAAGVPLTLLLDLATGLDSHEVYDREPGSADWLSVKVA